MAFRKRYGFRKSRRFARKRIGWKKRKAQKARLKGKKVYYFTRQSNLLTLTASNVFVGNGYNFILQQAAGYTDFTPLFDQYKISAVKLTFIPWRTNSTVEFNSVAAGTNTIPRFATAIDYDDSSAPANFDVLRQYQTCKITPITQKHTVFLKPMYSNEVYNGATSAYSPARGWLDCTYTQVPHYGLKVGIESAGTGSPIDAFGFNIEAKFYLAFRSVR